MMFLNSLLSRLTAILTNINFADGEIFSITFPVAEWPCPQLLCQVNGYRYCAYPNSNRVYLGIGTAIKTTATGVDRLNCIQHFVSNLRSHWMHIDPDVTGLQPQAFLALAFDPESVMSEPWVGIPNTLFEVPAVLLQRQGEITGITFSGRIIDGKPDTTIITVWQQVITSIWNNKPETLTHQQTGSVLTQVAINSDDVTWLNLAEQARCDIQAQILDKVVLARRICVQGQHDFYPDQVMKLLAERYPNCTQIAIDLEENGILVAASPERLVTVRANNVICEAVAGTAALSDIEASQNSDSELLSSNKIRHEHALVVEHIKFGLSEHCLELKVPAVPEIFSLRLMYHLRSFITGKLKKTSNLFDLLEQLHPTPAVGGTPTRRAVTWIKDNESLERGWYTGACGWFDPMGDGEFTVILRCALLRGARADLFAGAGIVEESEPDAELEEIHLKLKTLQDILKDV